MIKRVFDAVMAAIGLILVLPVIALTAILVKLTSPGSVLFLQQRVGRNFASFKIYKFRTMVQDAPRLGGMITVGNDPRITRVGRFLRGTKLDELPQLLNVIRGDMSLVGPRPEAFKYVEMFREDYKEILRVRPGITDIASIKYRAESSVLAGADDPEEVYVQVILPEKICLAKEYICRSSFWFDLYLILRTILKICGDGLARGIGLFAPGIRRRSKNDSAGIHTE